MYGIIRFSGEDLRLKWHPGEGRNLTLNISAGQKGTSSITLIKDDYPRHVQLFGWNKSLKKNKQI